MDIKNYFIILAVANYFQIETHADHQKIANDSNSLCRMCQFTVKELDRWLQYTGRKGHYSIEAAISKSLDSICNEKEQKTMSEDSFKMIACKELLADHAHIFKEALVEHYESAEPVSYMKLVQEVCYKKLQHCGQEESNVNVKPILQFNTENQMEIVDTKNLRTLKPTEEQ
ncbi:uncharacterized protein LOC115212366 [Argonauta hians]